MIAVLPDEKENEYDCRIFYRIMENSTRHGDDIEWKQVKLEKFKKLKIGE